MKIVVDGLPLRCPGTGIPRYTLEMLRSLHRVAPRHDFFITDCHAPVFQRRISLPSHPDEFDGSIRRQVNWAPKLWIVLPRRIRQAIIRQDLRGLHAELYFGTNYFGLFDRSFKTVITIHDLVYHHYPEATEPYMLRRLSQELPAHAHRADAIFTDSKASRRDIIDLLKVPEEKVHTIYCGVDHSFRPIEDQAALESVRRRYSLPDQFLLFVGTIEPRKNLVTLLAAFARVVADPKFRHSLVIVGGKGWKDSPIRNALTSNQATERLITTGYVAGKDLPLIYNLADALIMPSFYEGFGLPVVEAMACGTPVVTSNVSSLPEVAGDAAIFVDPKDADDVARGMSTVVHDPQLRADLRQKGLLRAREFSWEKSARQALNVFEQVTDKRIRSHPSGTFDPATGATQP